MNCSNLVGFVTRTPKINETKEKNYFSKFQLLVKSPNTKFTAREWVKVNCMAYGNEALYLFRNCVRGTLISVEGFLADMVDERTIVSRQETITKQVTINYLVVTKIEAITTRKIVLEDWDAFINRYSSASIKRELDQQRREERKKAKELNATSYQETVDLITNELIEEELRKSEEPS